MKSKLIPLLLKSSRAVALPWQLTGGIPAANCKAAYAPEGAASLAASYVNLANPGTDATPIVVPTWDAVNGWKHNGSACIDTGITPTNNQTWSMIIKYSGWASSFLAGCSESSGIAPYFFLTPNPTFGFGNGSYLGVSTVLTSGVMCVAGNKCFENGIQIPGTISTNAGNFFSIYIGGLNSGGTPNLLGIFNIQKLAIYDIDISSYVAALTAAM